VTVVGFIPHVLAVRTDHPAKSLADLVATARAKPDSVTYASSGNGTSAHLAAALLASEAKVSMLHVPYKGAGPALTDLLSGQVECMFLDTNSAIPQIRAGKLRALAAAPRRRIALLPDVPTVAEQGYPNFDVHGWYGLLARAGTPEPMVNLLHNAVRIALATPEVREQFRGAAVDAGGMPPAEYREIIRNDLVKWKTLVDRLQIKLD
jgi:tripartite-type tricarboxylate transporter receptor subunit TctC